MFRDKAPWSVPFLSISLLLGSLFLNARTLRFQDTNSQAGEPQSSQEKTKPKDKNDLGPRTSTRVSPAQNAGTADGGTAAEKKSEKAQNRKKAPEKKAPEKKAPEKKDN